ncbi:MAG: Beta-propeller repeat protein [Planctomycetes bacterium ADurb.Bin412]|nr:MAG: Beta-propeller repeat protein [Planctomycetes bacterium ADurb.Bin412]
MKTQIQYNDAGNYFRIYPTNYNIIGMEDELNSLCFIGGNMAQRVYFYDAASTFGRRSIVARYDDADNKFYLPIIPYYSYAGPTCLSTDGTHIYIGTNYQAYDQITVLKLDNSLNLVWDYNTGNRVFGVAADGSGNVYAVGDRSGGKTVWKLNSSGVLQWDWAANTDLGQDSHCVAVDASGNAYVGGDKVTTKSIWKLDPSGSLITDGYCSDIPQKICIDGSGYVYVVGERTSSKSVWKLDSNLNLIWDYDTGANTRGVSVDSLGNVIVTGLPSSDKAVWKLNSSGALQWDYEIEDGALDVTTDSSNNIYVVGFQYGIIRLNASGELDWSFDTLATHSRIVVL